jgi:hypothetical protein
MSICLDRDGVTIHNGDCLEVLRTLPDESVQCCVTSPPYWGLRDYGHDGQIGLESTPEAYVGRMVEVFREVRRVLREDGTLWLNLGDSYAASTGVQTFQPQQSRNGQQGVVGPRDKHPSASRANLSSYKDFGSLKPKDLVGIPWRVAFALQADGWYLRQDIIWHKPNPMPESVTDRCTKSHEYVFLMAKSQRYYYDAEAIAEDAICDRKPGRKITDTRETHGTGGGNAGINSLLARYHEDSLHEALRRRTLRGDASRSGQAVHSRRLSGGWRCPRSIHGVWHSGSSGTGRWATGRRHRAEPRLLQADRQEVQTTEDTVSERGTRRTTSRNRSTSMSVSGSMRDRRVSEVSGTNGTGSNETRDMSLRRLERLSAILDQHDWEKLREWRESQWMALRLFE